MTEPVEQRQLKACPFCGCSKIDKITYGCGDASFCCGQCGAEGPEQQSEQLAAEAWNQRDLRPDDALRDMVLAAIEGVRANNAGDFKRSGAVWEAYDLAVLECHQAARTALEGNAS